VGGIFINYRRRDSEYIAGRLRNDLAKHFGTTFLIFRDVDSMPLGPYPQEIDQVVQSCDVMLVVIGDGWLDARDDSGRRRLDQSQDWVRQEIASALKYGKVVVPVLVEGANLPPAEELPADIKDLVFQQTAVLPDSRWDYEVGQLVQKLRRSLKKTAPAARPTQWPMPRWAPVAAAVVGIAVLGAVALPGTFGHGSDGSDGDGAPTTSSPATTVTRPAREYVGPWAASSGSLTLTVEKIVSTDEGMQIHLSVNNGTGETLILPASQFNLVDTAGHSYRTDPRSAGWPMNIPPGQVRGVISITELLDPQVTGMRAGWGTVFGRTEVHSIYVQSIRLR